MTDKKITKAEYQHALTEARKLIKTTSKEDFEKFKAWMQIVEDYERQEGILSPKKG